MVSDDDTQPESESGNAVGPNNISVHDFLHPDCAGNCEFNDQWLKVWRKVPKEDHIEWETDDRLLNKLLRFNLTRPPSSRDGLPERRKRHALLTIRDITQYRKAHEVLKKREEDLVELVRKQSIELTKAQSRLDSESEIRKEDGELLANFNEKIRSLSHGIIMAQETERKRIASDLHDGIAQSLTILKFSVEAGIEKLKAESKDLDLSTLDNVVDQIKGAVEEIRRISSHLAPTMLEDFGLEIAVERLCEEFESHDLELSVQCSLSFDGKEAQEPVAIAIYRVVQEGLQNAGKHAGASLIDVTVDWSDDGITLTIRDDGVGIDPQDQEQGSYDRPRLGLRSMQERVETTGGLFAIETDTEKGTTLRAVWAEKELQLLGN